MCSPLGPVLVSELTLLLAMETVFCDMEATVVFFLAAVCFSDLHRVLHCGCEKAGCRLGGGLLHGAPVPPLALQPLQVSGGLERPRGGVSVGRNSPLELQWWLLFLSLNLAS